MYSCASVVQPTTQTIFLSDKTLLLTVVVQRPSIFMVASAGEAECSTSHTEHLRGAQDVEDVDGSEEANGMDPQGFLPSEKVVKPLTLEALAAYKAAQDRAGVVYISRIPPGMQPTKVRHFMSAYGEIGRIYLQPEG